METSITNSKIQLKNLSLPELTLKTIEVCKQKFRAQQVIKWIYQKRVNSFEEMSNIPKELRMKMAEVFTIDKMKVQSVIESKHKDAVKFGFALQGTDKIIESVLLFDGTRRTACVSSQLGCGLGCVFCETGKMGLLRNLTQDEIIGQLIGINDYLESHNDKIVTNIVFMGMGEALSNFEHFRSSLDIIMNEECFGIGGRRITVSTAGVVPSIEKLIGENLNIGLAISLNSFSNEQRDKLMPINRKYPIETLVAIAKRYFEKTGRRVTFEYVLIKGETDTPEAVRTLQRLLGGFPCKINLISVNPGSGNHFRGPDDRGLDSFAEELAEKGLAVTVRKSRGRDIDGACGQLSSKVDCTVQS